MEGKSVRVNIGISAKTKKWFEDMSNETGISQSALMSIALNEYIDQKHTIQAMGAINAYLAKLEGISEQLKKLEPGQSCVSNKQD